MKKGLLWRSYLEVAETSFTLLVDSRLLEPNDFLHTKESTYSSVKQREIWVYIQIELSITGW